MKPPACCRLPSWRSPGSAGRSAATAATGAADRGCDLPYLEIISPMFFWSDAADVVAWRLDDLPERTRDRGRREQSSKGKASLRILESYPDGESWVVRVVNRQKAGKVQSLQVRGFALCMLPAARKASVLMAQQPKLMHLSTGSVARRDLRQHDRPPGLPAGRAVISGGFGLDPDYRGPASAAAGAELPRSGRLERPGGQRRASGARSRRARLCGLPRH